MLVSKLFIKKLQSQLGTLLSTGFGTALSIVAINVLSGCGGGSSAAPAVTEPSPTAPVITTVQEVLDAAVSNGINGIFVYVDQGESAGESYTAGMQNTATQAPADPNTLFKVASISKLFIAVAATKMVVAEQINLTDSVSSWLPELADRIANADSITIEQLIQHRSGIADFDSQAGFSWQNAHTDIDATLSFALDKPADFAPNSQYEYSNTNYLLLAKILDKALGYSHHQYISENILIPLGMHNTYAELGDIEFTLLSKGYWGGVERSAQDYVIPGGSMISTVSDIALFIRALNTGNLLSESERNIYASVYWFNHSGWLPGYQSIANYHSNIDAVVIQFVNTTGGSSESIASSSYQQIIDVLNQ